VVDLIVRVRKELRDAGLDAGPETIAWPPGVRGGGPGARPSAATSPRQGWQIRVVNAATGELLRELVLDPSRDYQPMSAPQRRGRKPPK
jgi:hypothetical protein